MNNKNEEEFTKKLVKMASVEKPEADFTSGVMDKIHALSNEEVINKVAQPLISRTGWFIIAFIIVGVFSALFLFDVKTTNLFGLAGYFNNLTITVPSIIISNTLLYAIVIFAFYFSVQIIIAVRRLSNPKEV